MRLPDHPLVHEIFTWVWLDDLARDLGRPVDLASVPAEEWDRIARPGVDGVRLVWSRREACAAITGANPAMLVLDDVHLRTWGERSARPTDDTGYWPAVLDAARRAHPDVPVVPRERAQWIETEHGGSRIVTPRTSSSTSASPGSPVPGRPVRSADEHQWSVELGDVGQEDVHVEREWGGDPVLVVVAGRTFAQVVVPSRRTPVRVFRDALDERATS